MACTRRALCGALLVLCLTLSHSPAAAQGDGPFGLSMGLSKAQIERLTGGPLKPVAGQSDGYETTKVPRGLDGIESYVLNILPKAGLCRILAIGVDINTSSHGVEVKAAFDRLAGLLDAAYGKHTTYDFLRSGSIWDEPEDWMAGLMRNERVLQAAWDVAEGSTMKNGVSEILLDAHGLRSDRGYLNIQYKFDNRQACEAEAKGLTSNVL